MSDLTLSEVDLVLVARLRRLLWSSRFWPAGLSRLTRPRVLRARPRGYRDEDDRMGDRGYDAGRVHHFLRRLRSPLASRQADLLEPICLDTQWHGIHPVGLVLLDGNHRFAAHVLARRRLIPVSFSGPVDVLQYLTGEIEESPLS